MPTALRGSTRRRAAEHRSSSLSAPGRRRCVGAPASAHHPARLGDQSGHRVSDSELPELERPLRTRDGRRSAENRGRAACEDRRRREPLGIRTVGIQCQHVLHPPVHQRRKEVPSREHDWYAPGRAAGRRRHRRRGGRSGQRLFHLPRRAADGDRLIGLERQRQHLAQECRGGAARRCEGSMRLPNWAR